MNFKVKIVAYVLIVSVTVFFAYRFYQSYNSAMANPLDRGSSLEAEGITPDEEVSKESKTGSMMTNGAFLFISIILLALLSAHDISRFFAARAEAFIYSDTGESIRDPEYEQAEKLWADGQHLDAIQLMREHLKKNPRHQYVAIRIAEIYENDLKNYVASALEYEEVLKKRLDPERWGWAAIHLANIYNGKLGKPEQAETLLRRINDEYGKTGAAKKARERLGIPEPEPEPDPEESVENAEPETPTPARPESNLPRGFRPKKG